MPRTLYDENGNAVEGLPDENELKELLEVKTKLPTLEEQAKKAQEYENDPAYKNFGVLRKSKEQAEKERDEWRKKAEESEPKDKEKKFTQEEVEKTAAIVAEKKYQEKYLNSIISQHGDKKDVVKAYFDKLSAGEELDEEKIEKFAQQAAELAGVAKKSDLHQVISRQSGSGPSFDDPGDRFANSEQGRKNAYDMGLNYAKPKGEPLNMLNISNL